MKQLLAKVWKSDIKLYYLVYALIVIFSQFVLQKYSLNMYESYLNNFTNLEVTNYTVFYIGVMMGNVLVSLVLTIFLLAIYWRIFVYVYAMSFRGGNLVRINELPIGNISFKKIILMFMIVANFILGFFRLIYLNNPLYSSFIENIIRPLLFGTLAVFCFLTTKKYILEGNVAFNTLLAMGIPYLIFFILY